MKKKTLFKFLSIALSAAISVTSIPVTATPVQAEEIEVIDVATPEEETVEDSVEETVDLLSTEQVSGNDVTMTEEAAIDETADITEEVIDVEDEEIISEEETDEDLYFAPCELDIFSLSPDASEEELSRYFEKCNDYDIATWLKTLSDEQIATMMEKDTILSQTLDYYGPDLPEKTGIKEGDHFETGLDYFKALGKDDSLKATAAKTTGEFYIDINGKVATVKIRDLSTTESFKNANGYAVTTTISNASNGLTITSGGNRLGYYGGSGKEGADKVIGYAQNITNGGTLAHTDLFAKISFTKPAGYTIKYTKENNNTSGAAGIYIDRAEAPVSDGRHHYCYYSPSGGAQSTVEGLKSDSAQTVSVWTITDVVYNAGVGYKGTSGTYKNVTYKFEFVPCEYTVQYNSNGGSAVGTQTCTYGTTYGTAGAPATAPTYTASFDNASPSSVPRAFGGWSGAPGATYSNLTTVNGGHVTFTAAWGNATTTMPSPTNRVTNCYTINYDTKGKATTPSSQTTTKTWQKWMVPNVGYFAEGQAVTLGGNTSFQSVWSGSSSVKLPNIIPFQYTVHFDSQGGNAVSDKTTNRTFAGWAGAGKAGTSYTPSGDVTLTATYSNESITLPSATKAGYTFQNWENGNNTYNAGASYTPASNTTLTAVWKANDYEVQFHNNNGSETDTIVPQSFVYDEEQALSAFATLGKNFAKTGYHFAGWATSPTGSVVYTDGQTVKNLAENGTVDLYAVWVPDSYDITFVYGNGKADEKITANYDEDVTIPTAEKTLTAEYILDGGYIKGSNKTSETFDYTLLGYKRSDDDEAELIQPGTQKILSTSGDVTLTAQYDGSGIIITLPEAVKDGYDFRGWTVEGISNSAIESTWKAAGSKIYLNTDDFSQDEDKDARSSYLGAEEALGKILDGAKMTIKANWKESEKPYIPDDDPTDPTKPVIDEETKNQINSILEALKKLSSTSEISSTQIEELTKIIKSVYNMDNSTAKTLIDFINNSSMSEKDKLELLQALASGSVSEELRAKLIAAISASTSLTQAQKDQLIAALNRISSLSLEEQKKILALLTSGSSVTYMSGGITFTLQKNADGSLTIALQALNGKKDIVIPDQITVAGQTYAITEIGKNAFKGNTTIETVKMGNNITKIGDSAFEGCKNLKSITLSGSITSIGNKAFKGCTSLTKIDIPATCKTIGESAFEGCSKLKTVVLRNGLIQIGKKAFYKCVALTKIKIPKTTLKIGSYAFSGCKKLYSVTFATDAQLTEMGTGVFANDVAIKKIKLPGKLTAIPTKAFYGCKKLYSVTGGKNITKVGAQSFEKCIAIKSITLQARVQTIYKRAFYGCKNLKTVSIKSKALTSIGSKAFKGCKKGIKFKVPNSKIASYTSLLKGKY